MNNYVTNRQIAFILFLTLTSYSVIDVARAFATSAGYGSWFTVIIGSIFFAFIAVINVKLNYKYKGEMIFEYSQRLVGKFGAYLIAIYYILYFSLIVVFLDIQLASVLKQEFIPQTPKAATLLVGIPVFCFIAYKGLITLARLMEYTGMIYLVSAIIVHLIMLTQGHLYNILPLFNSADIMIYFEALKEVIFPFLGIEILLIIPLSRKNGKSVITTVFITIICIGLFYVLIIESCIIKLGMYDIAHYNSSLIVAIRDMELPFLDFLKRLDVLFLTIGFAGFFMGASVVYTAILEFLSKLLPKAKRGILITIIGVVSYIACLILDKVKSFSPFVLGTGLYLGMISVFLIPVILLIISKVKKNA